MSSRLTLRANALSFSFFFTEDGFTSRERLRRLHEGAGDEEAAELVAGEERLRHLRRARDVRVRRMSKDRGAELLVEAALLEDLRADEGMLFGVRVRLVVEVVQQAADAPADGVFIRRVLFRARLHRLLDREGMLAERVGLRELVEESQRFFA